LQKAATFIPKVLYGKENTIFITPELLNLILFRPTNTYVQFYKSTGFRIDPCFYCVVLVWGARNQVQILLNFE